MASHQASSKRSGWSAHPRDLGCVLAGRTPAHTTPPAGRRLGARQLVDLTPGLALGRMAVGDDRVRPVHQRVDGAAPRLPRAAPGQRRVRNPHPRALHRRPAGVSTQPARRALAICAGFSQSGCHFPRLPSPVPFARRAGALRAPHPAFSMLTWAFPLQGPV